MKYPLLSAARYVSMHQEAKAQETLLQVLARNPSLVEFCEQDPDISSLLTE